MKRTVAKILCVCLVIGSVQTCLFGQDRPFRLGFQTSPGFSWIHSNDKLIVRNGGNFGIKLGTTADISFKDNYSFTLGFNLGFHQGGEFLYEIGGNYLPKSTLSIPELQTGDKPLPDGVKIRYSLQYLEFPLGLKIRSSEIGYTRYFIEAPIFTFAFLTRGRGDIETTDNVYPQENIYKDLTVANIFWGLGAGMEYSISQNNAIVGGIYFHNGIFDFTRDNGKRAIDNPNQDPNNPDDDYLLQDENSRATVSNFTIRLGIIF